MRTRTELILLQRTMVVVEGVSRSLYPQINIWEVARPVVEGYIKENIGPKALARDMRKTAMVLARFGPRLPQLAETALIRQADEPGYRAERRSTLRERAALVALGGGLVALGAMLAGALG